MQHLAVLEDSGLLPRSKPSGVPLLRDGDAPIVESTIISKSISRLKRGRPVVTSPWRIVPPPQRFSTQIGCIQSAIDFREFSPTAAGRKFFPQGAPDRD
jgi:hypothetical protein